MMHGSTSAWRMDRSARSKALYHDRSQRSTSSSEVKFLDL
jgi:hypothetical protein